MPNVWGKTENGQPIELRRYVVHKARAGDQYKQLEQAFELLDGQRLNQVGCSISKWFVAGELRIEIDLNSLSGFLP
jgi:hypothetical protein